MASVVSVALVVLAMVVLAMVALVMEGMDMDLGTDVITADCEEVTALWWITVTSNRAASTPNQALMSPIHSPYQLWV